MTTAKYYNNSDYAGVGGFTGFIADDAVTEWLGASTPNHLGLPVYKQSTQMSPRKHDLASHSLNDAYFSLYGVWLSKNKLHTLCGQIIYLVIWTPPPHPPKKARHLCESLCPASSSTKSKKVFFLRIQVKVKVTRSMSMMLFERASLVEKAYQIYSLYLFRFKS